MHEQDQQIKEQEYDTAATSASKNTIFVFVATFLYMLFGTDISPTFIEGTIFVVVGMFVVSIAISMPLMIIRVKFPKMSLILSLIDIAITIFMTRLVYLLLFSN